ncbi:MAG TPA: TetR/AcrR family transcriptional regulator C-terminal domain-containing protein [Bryobacteraceae bacterium]|nr:TetR/AcrR family transcriptional regulator C-terminal domain-containing protein [Bryobacteraceae bacterium]
MSILPYRKAERKQKRRQLDQAQVVHAALELLDEVGLDELTMRRLADRLGVKAASLYRHVKDKEELLALLGDEISGEIPLASPSGSWREQLTAMAWNVRRGLLAHRDAARVLAGTPPFGPRRLKHIEDVLRVLRSAGLSPSEAARAAYHCNNFIMEFVADEMRFAAFASAPRSSRKKIFTQARKHFQSLPREEYPNLVELAGELSEDDQDGLFQFGLEVWLRGIGDLAK